jgi:hypothetical protein
MSCEFEFAIEAKGDLVIVTEPTTEFHAIFVKRADNLSCRLCAERHPQTMRLSRVRFRRRSQGVGFGRRSFILWTRHPVRTERSFESDRLDRVGLRTARH